MGGLVQAGGWWLVSDQQNVEYEPPSAEQIERFVRDFYREYSDERPDRAKVLAVTGFLKSVARALAKDLTRKASG